MIEEVMVDCPSCGETISMDVDVSGGDEQEYVQDCPVCCRPMDVFIRCADGEVKGISVSAQ
jgi:Cysteine-rich CPXCG